ncbi:MAG: hypothetical protein EOO73_28260 [Myxococcales bacterium]|nr:MAG: hypothetical protein EOO73_28260 [Myxococcales bacterium]
MTFRLSFLVSLAALACTPEPARNPDAVSQPRQPDGAAQSGATTAEQVTTQTPALTESTAVDHGPASATAAPRSTTAFSPSDGASGPSSTQANPSASPAPDVPNAMPQPDAL